MSTWIVGLLAEAIEGIRRRISIIRSVVNPRR